MTDDQFEILIEQLKVLEENQDNLQLLYEKELERQSEQRKLLEQQQQKLETEIQETIVEDPYILAINENSVYIQQVFFLCFIIVCFLILQFIWRMVYKAFSIFTGSR